MNFAELASTALGLPLAHHHHFHGHEAFRKISAVQMIEALLFDYIGPCQLLETTAHPVEQGTHPLVLSQIVDGIVNGGLCLAEVKD